MRGDSGYYGDYRGYGSGDMRGNYYDNGGYGGYGRPYGLWCMALQPHLTVMALLLQPAPAAPAQNKPTSYLVKKTSHNMCEVFFQMACQQTGYNAKSLVT